MREAGPTYQATGWDNEGDSGSVCKAEGNSGTTFTQRKRATERSEEGAKESSGSRERSSGELKE